MLTIKNISKLNGYEAHPWKIDTISTNDDTYIFLIDNADKHFITTAVLNRIPQDIDGNILYSLTVYRDEQLIPKSLLSSPKSLGKHIINLLNMIEFTNPF